MKRITTYRFGDKHNKDMVRIRTQSRKHTVLELSGTPSDAFNMVQTVHTTVSYEDVVVEIGPDTELGTTVKLSAKSSLRGRPVTFFTGYATLQDPESVRKFERRQRRLQRQG